MKTEFRNRVFLPIVLPLAVLLAMALVIGGVAAILLYNTHEGALAVATVAAAGILLTASLASSQDRLDGSRRAVIAFAAVVPFALGGAYAAGLLGDIADEDRNINAQPLLVVPDDAPHIVSENSIEFCLDTDAGCEPAETWEVTPSTEAEVLLFVFENREVGVPHNVVIAELDGTTDDPAPGADILVTETITGQDETVYRGDGMGWDELPEEWYFFCAIHPQMAGVGTVAGAEG
ncbi:hypothetical protein [Egicoccus sp. AB-alg6-2]|uniref:hypothetical protein n=1 Tax=Egicoccus sp. AB-alg6-2 TaxID=3242692 RepID=UPI00359DCDE9